MSGNEGSIPRSSGALTTRLNSSLERARAALAPHAGLLPGGNLAKVEAMLVELAARRVRIALYGEVKAGKSSLLNAIAGSALSPVAFEPLTSIPLRVTYGEQTVWRVGEQVFTSAEEVAQLMRTDDPGAREVTVETDLDLLQLGGQVDLLDTPGVGSEDRFDAITGDLLRSLDAVVLVVRYPGLFTQVTRRLMDGLQSEMGKLFVVWNLDQACAELTASERTQHTETLRANVAGAHDLFLIDARQGLEATQRRDAAAIAASGLGAFTAALARFVASAGRDLAAVRETSKRALRFLGKAQRALGERREMLADSLRQARERLQTAKAASTAETDAARARHEEFEATLTRIAGEYRAAADKEAESFRQRLRAARSAWVRSANETALAEAVAHAAGDYADAAESSARQTVERLNSEADAYGAIALLAARPRAPFELGDLAPEERLREAVLGNFQLVRRAIWRRWYLPGVESLMGTRLTEERGAQEAWVEGIVSTLRGAAAQTQTARLADIDARGQAEQAMIKQETSFDANQAELDRLDASLPVLRTEADTITQITGEAKSFL